MGLPPQNLPLLGARAAWRRLEERRVVEEVDKRAGTRKVGGRRSKE